MLPSNTKRRALCLVDARDPVFLAIYSAFEAHFAFTLAEARSLLFANIYDVIIMDLSFRPEESLQLTTVAERMCPWIPLVGFHTPAVGDVLDKLPPGRVLLHDKTTIRQRTDAIALGVIMEEEKRLKTVDSPVSPLFVDQQHDLVRLTSTLYRQNDLLLSLNEFAEELLGVLPDVIASVFYVRRCAAVTVSNFPLHADVLKSLRSDMLDAYGRLVDGPLAPEQVQFDFRGAVSKRPETQFELRPGRVTPVVERGALAGFLMLSRMVPPPEAAESALYQEKYCAKHLHEAFILYNQIRNRTITDPLSGLYNYAFLQEYLQKTWTESRRRSSGMGIVLADIDQLKRINDGYGYRVADTAIADVARIISDLASPEHVAARYRGGQFAVVLSDTDAPRTKAFAERLVEDVRNHVFREVGFSLRLTVSAGIVVSNTLNERDEVHLLEMADKALMLAKRSGRNQVCSALEIYSKQGAAPVARAPAEEEPETRGHILVVDDEPASVRLLVSFCKRWGYQVTGVGAAREAIEIVQSGSSPVDVVLADISMPELNGIEMTRILTTIDPDIVVVTVSGHGTTDNAIEALRAGVYNFVLKPVNQAEMEMVVKRALERRRLLQHRTAHRLHLEELLNERTQALQASVDALKGSYAQTLETIVSILDVRGPHRTDHSRRVSEFAVFLAGKMGIEDPKALQTIRYGALLHDIGKLGVPEVGPVNGEPLSRQEADQLTEHIELGHRIVRTIPILEDAAELVYTHHERVDGSGYPRRLKDDQIPIGAKILAIADAFDSWRFDRQDRRGLPLRQVVQMINEYSGTRFAPDVVRAFNNCYSEMDTLFMKRGEFWEHMEFPKGNGTRTA